MQTYVAMIPTLGGDGGRGLMIISSGVQELEADRSFSRTMLGHPSPNKSRQAFERVEATPSHSLVTTMNAMQLIARQNKHAMVLQPPAKRLKHDAAIRVAPSTKPRGLALPTLEGPVVKRVRADKPVTGTSIRVCTLYSLREQGQWGPRRR